MPVRKFRTVAEMPGPAPLPPLRGDNLREAIELSRFAGYLARTRRAPGVRKYRGVDDPERAELEATRARP